jgi:hypothetical protein
VLLLGEIMHPNGSQYEEQQCLNTALGENDELHQAQTQSCED